MGPSLKSPSFRYHPWYSVLVVAWTAFCHPGMFSALNGLGAGGEESATTSNITNAVTFGALTVGGFFTGAICNRIGVRWTLVLGTLGYAPYGAALYTNAKFGNSWFPILGGLLCGSSGIFLWTASGAINLVFPPVHQRGRAVATKFTFQNTGGFIGGIISIALNAKQAKKGRVSDATFYAITSIMCLGLPLALTLPTHPSHVVRKDKSRVVAHKFLSWKDEAKGLGAMLTKKEFLLLAPFFIYAQWDLSYMWTWNATYHSVRARAVLSTCFYLIGPTIIGLIQGWLLDKTSWSRITRGRVGVTSFAIITALTWVFGLIVQYQYDNRDPTQTIDIVDPVFAKSLLLFILYGLIENSAMVIIYWVIGSVGFGPGQIASIVGLCNAFGSAGSTSAFIIGAVGIELKYQLWANVITFLVGIPGLLYIGWFGIVQDEKLVLPTSTGDSVPFVGDVNNPQIDEEAPRDTGKTGVISETALSEKRDRTDSGSE